MAMVISALLIAGCTQKQDAVPFFIGTNADDGKSLSTDANMSVSEYQSLIRNYFGKDADVVLAQYPAGSPDEVRLCFALIMTRYDFADAAKFAAGSMADLSPDTYLYRYSYVLPGPVGQANGVFHGSGDLPALRVRACAERRSVGE